MSLLHALLTDNTVNQGRLLCREDAGAPLSFAAQVRQRICWEWKQSSTATVHSSLHVLCLLYFIGLVKVQWWKHFHGFGKQTPLFIRTAKRQGRFTVFYRCFTVSFSPLYLAGRSKGNTCTLNCLKHFFYHETVSVSLLDVDDGMQKEGLEKRCRDVFTMSSRAKISKVFYILHFLGNVFFLLNITLNNLSQEWTCDRL